MDTEDMLQDEPQLDELVEQQDETPIETAASEEVAPKAVDDFVELDEAAQKKFNKLTWEKNEQKRRNEELEKRLAGLEATKPQEPAPLAPVAPAAAMPDNDLIYSDPEEYQKQVKVYNQSVLEQTRELARAEAKAALEAQSADAHKIQIEARAAEQQQGFVSRALETGIPAEKLIESENIVAAYKPHHEVAEFIMDDPNGPEIMHYLAQNQQVLAEVVSMSPMRAALKLEGLRAKALTKKASAAPDPISTDSGREPPATESPLLKGATFE
jgi:hypothetical protein